MAVNEQAFRARRVMRDAPVIPVIVMRRRRARGAAGARAGGRRHPHARSDAAHAARRSSASRRSPRRCPRPWSAPAPCAAPPMRRPRALAGARFGVSPGYTRAVGKACHDLGLPLLPGVATGSEIMMAAGRRPDRAQVLPGRAGRRPGDAEGLARARSATSSSARPAASRRQRARVPGARQRGVRRRLVDRRRPTRSPRGDWGRIRRWRARPASCLARRRGWRKSWKAAS